MTKQITIKLSELETKTLWHLLESKICGLDFLPESSLCFLFHETETVEGDNRSGSMLVASLYNLCQVEECVLKTDILYVYAEPSEDVGEFREYESRPVMYLDFDSSNSAELTMDDEIRIAKRLIEFGTGAMTLTFQWYPTSQENKEKGKWRLFAESYNRN